MLRARGAVERDVRGEVRLLQRHAGALKQQAVIFLRVADVQLWELRLQVTGAAWKTENIPS
ncbi:hypothetical protein NG99_22800 [Erwinia typographi]|uniref:Uncharacterized protein n=1 Tax=Erwinia typographi TaxID=371042 RepID=A0A0A3YR41_9GAMM|nr:hypothetical protein NG99_22800 [Erwinia typographi]